MKITVNVLHVDDDHGAYVFGIGLDSDELLARFREHLVDRFGEDEVAHAESEYENGLAGLELYDIVDFELEVPNDNQALIQAHLSGFNEGMRRV